jgi:hypothetical protein
MRFCGVFFGFFFFFFKVIKTIIQYVHYFVKTKGGVGGGYHAVSVPELASATWSGRGQVSLQKCVFVGFFLVFFFVVFFFFFLAMLLLLF